MQRVTVVKPSRAVGFVRRHDSESAKSFVSSGVTMGWLLRLVTGGPLVVGGPRQFYFILNQRGGALT